MKQDMKESTSWSDLKNLNCSKQDEKSLKALLGIPTLVVRKTKEGLGGGGQAVERKAFNLGRIDKGIDKAGFK